MDSLDSRVIPAEQISTSDSLCLRQDCPGGTEISVKRSMTVEQPIPVPSDVEEQKNIERAMTVAEYCV